MAKLEDKMENGDEAPATPTFDKPKPDYEKDPNVQARKRAAKRSGNRNSGKPVDDGVFGEAEAPKADGGIVAEAEEELAEAKAEGEEEPKAEEETPAAEEPKAEEETPAAEETKAEEETPAAEEPKAEEETPAEEASEPASEEATETPADEEAEPSEYQAPEGESHADLVNRYHEAIAYGDIQQANELYMQLQDHRYQENKFRAHKEAIDEAEAREHLAAAKEMAAKHPELAEDGVAANKVLALAEVYRQEGLKPAAALRQACADLYPESTTGTSTPEVPPAETKAEEATPAESAEEPAAEGAEAESGDSEAGGLIPDMEERSVKKRSIAEVPAASARNEPEPPAAKPTRSSAIVDMKRARGQL